MTLRRHMNLNHHKYNFAVIGQRGAMHFWCFPLRIPNEVDQRFCNDTERIPAGGGIEQHSQQQMYEGQNPQEGKCWLTGKTCWTDGSSLQAREFWIPLFVSCNDSGDFEPLWEALEGEYKQRFRSEN